MIVRQILELFRRGGDYKPLPTFQAELNRQCKIIAAPAFLVGLFSWLPYIELDINLYPQLPLLPYLRVGLTIVGALCLILFLTPFSRKKSYYLLLFFVIYLESATALILGLVTADPAYMGGFSFLILILPILPFQKKHTLTILGASLIIFLAVGAPLHMNFKSWYQLYGGYNLIAALAVSLLAVFLLDNIRKQCYENHCAVHKVNEELQETFQELRNINEELGRTSLELSGKNEELRDANEIKSELLGIAAHDLRNPLQVIIGNTGLLQEKMKDDPTTFQKLNMINKSSDKILKLITNLLETSSIDNGKLKMKAIPLDVGQLAEIVVKDMRHVAEKKGQTILLTFQKGCVVAGDKMMLQQVMENLISNAIKFSPFEKTIWVTVEYDERSRDNSAARGGSIITFSVRDVGPGLTIEDRSKLYGKFQRLSARPTGGETSTGLGLSIIKGLVLLHGGAIRVESEPGKGSVFSVDLPVSREEATV
ncbi:MAG: HAMP domain-containing sensor histidine kinase [Candidatus Aminicenantes bacterium]|nr:HAMP domain-containing sensor histidine kinase [Candidatus Aminicenantes bacterium]